MNILTAPLANLLPSVFGVFPGISWAVSPGGPDHANSFLKFGTFLSLVIIVAGIYFIATGAQGQVDIETSFGKISTGVVGVALIFLGSALYLGIGKILLGRQGGRDDKSDNNDDRN